MLLVGYFIYPRTEGLVPSVVEVAEPKGVEVSRRCSRPEGASVLPCLNLTKNFGITELVFQRLVFRE